MGYGGINIMAHTIFDVLVQDYSECGWTMGQVGNEDKNNYEALEWAEDNTVTKPTKSALEAKVAALDAAEPMRLLRLERNRRLAETDFLALGDVTMSDEWKAYRQALRDLPATQTPVLVDTETEFDELELGIKNVTFPTKPS